MGLVAALLATQRKDVPQKTHITQGIVVGVNTLVTIVDVAATTSGVLAAILIGKTEIGIDRLPDRVQITVDGTVQDNTSLAGVTSEDLPFPRADSAIKPYPHTYPIGARFKSSLKVEIAGDANAGNFQASVIWLEDF